MVARIQQHVGVAWHAGTVDTFKAGDPDTPVTGIAVTMMATLDVLQRAAAAGKNMVITYEPTFYNHLDKLDEVHDKEKDPVLTAKLALIAEHKLVIWRFHDHWHERMPDGIEARMAHALGWEKYQGQGRENQYLFAIPETTLSALTRELREKLQLHVLRVVGEPQQKIKKVALVPGALGLTSETRALEIDDVDVVVTGEPREWETVEYVGDAVTEHKRKGLGYLEPHSLRAGRDGRVHAVVEDIRHGSASRVCGDCGSLLEKLKQVLRRVRKYAESRNATHSSQIL